MTSSLRHRRRYTTSALATKRGLSAQCEYSVLNYQPKCPQSPNCTAKCQTDSTEKPHMHITCSPFSLFPVWNHVSAREYITALCMCACMCVSCMPDRINEPPTLQAQWAWSMRPRFASNTFIIQHTVTALLISLLLSLSHSHPLLSPLLSPVSLSTSSPYSSYPPSLSTTIPLTPHAPFSSCPRCSLFFIFSILPRQPLCLSQPFSYFLLPPTPAIILFPGARDGISSPYASAPTCNMLAHDKIVFPSASCREWEQPSINTIHQSTVSGRHMITTRVTTPLSICIYIYTLVPTVSIFHDLYYGFNTKMYT